MERNSWQVRRYLEQYHGPSPGRFNRHRYSACTALYSAAEEATRAAREAAAGACTPTEFKVTKYPFKHM
jgi:hypothetical protein